MCESKLGFRPDEGLMVMSLSVCLQEVKDKAEGDPGHVPNPTTNPGSEEQYQAHCDISWLDLTCLVPSGLMLQASGWWAGTLPGKKREGTEGKRLFITTVSLRNQGICCSNVYLNLH